MSQLKRSLERIGIVGMLILSPFVIYYMTASKSQKVYHGIVVKFWARTTDTRIIRYLNVRLDDNRTVTISYQPASGVLVGRKVVVKEITTKFFGYKVYKITRWY